MTQTSPSILEILLGRGSTEDPNSLITHTGALNKRLLDREDSGVLGILGQGAEELVQGERGLEALKLRFQQGGLVGRGGIVRGAVALPSDLSDSFAQHGLVGSTLRNPIRMPLNLLERGLLLGAPVYQAYQAYPTEGIAGVVREAVRGAIFIAAYPLGLVGAGAAYLATDYLLPRPESKIQGERPIPKFTVTHHNLHQLAPTATRPQGVTAR